MTLSRNGAKPPARLNARPSQSNGMVIESGSSRVSMSMAPAASSPHPSTHAAAASIPGPKCIAAAPATSAAKISTIG